MSSTAASNSSVGSQGDTWSNFFHYPVADPGFPRGGELPGAGAGRQHTNLPNFPKNCMKLKEFGPHGGMRPLHPLRSTTVTARKRSLQRLCFAPVCQSFCSQGAEVSTSVHSGIANPHPRSRHPPEQTPHKEQTPLHSACWEIPPTSGRYASYWNAYLFSFQFAK